MPDDPTPNPSEWPLVIGCLGLLTILATTCLAALWIITNGPTP